MKTPNEERLASAIEQLGAAQTQGEIADGANELTDGMGLERYFILDIRGDLGAGVRGILLNAPSELRDEAIDHRILADDHVLAQANASNVPFVWEAGATEWRQKNGDLGYRSGVAAASYDGNHSGAIVILSGAEQRIPREHEATVLTFALMAAVTIAGALRQLDVPVKSSLSQRELDCLLYHLAGKSAKETARALGIEPRTVQLYLERARAKMHANNSYAAAMAALRNGWLDMGQAMELAGLAPGAGKIGTAAKK